MDAQRRQHAQPKAADHGASPDPEVLRLITEVESQLQGLKKVHAEREQTKAKLDERQSELEARAREQEARDREQEARDRELKEIADQLAARETETREAAEAALSRQAQIEKIAADLAQVENDSKERLARAAEERQAVESIAADLAVREKAIGERTARFDALQAEVRTFKHRLAETERTAAERAEELLRAHDDAADLARRLEEYQKHGPTVERQIAGLRAELEKSAAAAAAAQTELASRQQAIEELTERCRSLENRLSEQDSRQSEQARADLATRQQAIDELTGRCRALEQRLAEQQRELAARDQSANEVESRLDAAATALAKAVTERDQGREELERQKQHAAELQSRLAAAAKELKQTGAARDETAAALAKASAHAQELAARVGALQEQSETLRRQAASRAARVDAGMQKRRERMRRCRQLLRERSSKIRQASEMLKARHQQYEQVLSMRGEVITAKRAVDALQKKVQAASARTRAATAVFYLAGLVAILGGLSWAITRQVVPATYVARAVIVPEARGRTLNETELADWQSYHENLLSDPQFIELAAERMGRRGIATLATPGDLNAELDKSFDHQSAQNGQLVLELRGRGADRTQRILDTYVTALVSQANASKEHRTDGASTTISEAAKCESTPIEDPRPLYAAGVLGGSTVVFLLIGGLIWGRLAAAKQKFETEARIDEFVESPDWPAAKATG